MLRCDGWVLSTIWNSKVFQQLLRVMRHVVLIVNSDLISSEFASIAYHRSILFWVSVHFSRFFSINQNFHLFFFQLLPVFTDDRLCFDPWKASIFCRTNPNQPQLPPINPSYPHQGVYTLQNHLQPIVTHPNDPQRYLTFPNHPQLASANQPQQPSVSLHYPLLPQLI